MLSHFSHVWLCNPMDCKPTGSSVHGILQARTLEWGAMPSSRGSSRPRDQTCICSLPLLPYGESLLHVTYNQFCFQFSSSACFPLFMPWGKHWFVFVVVVQLLSHVQLFVTPLSFTISWSLLRLLCLVLTIASWLAYMFLSTDLQESFLENRKSGMTTTWASSV